MNNYIDLLKKLINSGNEKTDRTGTGTLSLFGEQLRFDLSKGFPLITTKKMFTKGLIGELLWFISGSVNNEDLKKLGVNWWTPWTRDDGSIGKGYGYQLRRQLRTNTEFKSQVSTTYTEEDFIYPEVDERESSLYKEWFRLKTEFNNSITNQLMYGYTPINLPKRWLDYKAFAEDAITIPGWDEHSNDIKLTFSDLESNILDKNKAKWINKAVKDYKIAVLNKKDSTIVEVESVHAANVLTGIKSKYIKTSLDCGLSVNKYVFYKSYKFGQYKKTQLHDQLKECIEGIKNNPDSRRHVISLWDFADAKDMELPCCHGSIIQFYVSNNKLSCHMYQRSADVFLGVPVNIACYALLTHMIAQITGLGAGEFIHTFGDVHLYKNHIDCAKEQISRKPYTLPKLELNPDIESIDDFKFEDIKIVGYKSHKKIKGAIAV